MKKKIAASSVRKVGATRDPAANGVPPALRVSAEPYSYHTEAEIHRALTQHPRDYFGFMKEALLAIATGAARINLPPKQVFHDAATKGDFRVMPCESAFGGRVTKTVKLIGTNTVQRTVPDQITVGKVLALDPEENFVSAIFEGCLLSSARTGVCAALAIDALGPAGGDLVVIGSGRVGIYSALYAAAGGSITRIRFCDLVPERARTAARFLAHAAPAIPVAACAVSAIAAADVVAVATTSATPVVSPPCWGAALVISLGADTDTQSELDPAWSRQAEIWCDTPDTLRFGDLSAWIAAGLLDPAGVSDLLRAYLEPRREPSRTRVFVSTGSALFDNLTVRYLLERGA